MDAKKISDVIVLNIKKSNLNYRIQESPFSLLINISKTFVRNKQGQQLLPASDTFTNVKSDKIEEENLSLKNHVNHLEVDLDASNKGLQILA